METKSKFSKIMFYVVMSATGSVFLFPLYYTFINSIRGLNDMPAILTPVAYEWENFKLAITMIPFWQYFKNSLIILGLEIPLGIVTNIIYGYALAKLRAPGRTMIFNMVLLTMMLPTFAIQIPQYILFSKIGLTDTYILWLCEGLAGSTALIFLSRQYLYSIPQAIIEAAYVDGCGPFQIFSKIVVPLSKPLCAIVIFKMFSNNWGDYMTPYMYLSREKYPLVMAMFSPVDYVLPGTRIVLTPVVNAASLFFAVPVIVLFFICQKQLVAGATASAVKG